MAPPSPGVVHLTTEIEVPHRRAELAKEVFGRQVLRLDVEPDPDQTVHVDLKLRALPGLKLVAGFSNGVTTPRTKALLADGNDDLFLSMSRQGAMVAEQRGERVVMGPGDVHLATNAEWSSYTHLNSLGSALLAPRAAIAALAPGVEDRLGRPMPNRAPGVDLLRDYVAHLVSSGALDRPALSQAVVSHIQDLFALVVGPSRDGREIIANRGLKAARLQAIKTYVRNNLAGREITLDGVAAAHRLERRYLQRLFEDAGTSFSAFVINERLTFARRLLTDPLHGAGPISAVAYESGFRDISHFNRLFRRQYGATPSEVREMGRLGGIARPIGL